jgi:tetratricopeptide (TPR) repeat protein
MAVGYLLFVAADFLPDATLTLRQDLPGVQLEGKQAKAVSRALGIELPDPSEAAEGEPIVRTHVTEIKLDAEDLTNWQEKLLQVALSPHGVKVVRAQSEGDTVAARARELIDGGQLELAIDELRAGPSVAESEERRVLLAEALLATGRREEAMDLVADVPASTGSADAWLVRGEAARALGRGEEALDAFEQAAALAIGNPGGTYRLDVLPLALSRLGRVASARTALADLQAAAPDEASLINVQAILDAQEGRFAEALAAMERVADVLPGRVLSALDDPVFSSADQKAIGALRARAGAARQSRGTGA